MALNYSNNRNNVVYEQIGDRTRDGAHGLEKVRRSPGVVVFMALSACNGGPGRACTWCLESRRSGGGYVAISYESRDRRAPFVT